MGFLRDNHHVNLAAQAWKYFGNALRPPDRAGRMRNMVGANLAAVAGKPFFGQPLRAYFHITNRCNNRCVICEPHKDGLYEGDSLDYALVEEMYKSFPRLVSVCFVGDGEPLLHPRTVDGIRLFATRNCWVNMTSNGILLTPAKAEELVDAGLSEIQVSLDGATPETVRQTRPNTDLPKVLEGLGRLLDTSRKVRGKALYSIISFCINRLNQHEIEAFVDLADKMGVDGVRFQNFIPYPGNTVALDADTKAGVRRRIYGMIAKGGHRTRIFYDDLETPGRNPFGFIRARCVHPFYNISVKPDGNVYPCCGLTRPIGNVADNSLHEIYHSDTRREFLERIASDDPPKECYRCVWLRRK